MNYQKIHDMLINKAKNRELNSYKETHHIVPKCMGGTNESENLIDLTAKEHFVIHHILTKLYPKHKGILWAFLGMRRNPYGKTKINSRMFENFKGKCHHTEEHKKYMSELNKGKKLSEEHKRKISETRKKRKQLYQQRRSYQGKNNGMYGKHLTEEQKKKISNSSKAYWKNMSEEQLNKIKKERSERFKGDKNPMYGKPLTEEHSKKVSEGLKRAYQKMTPEERKNKYGKTHMKGKDNPSALKLKVSDGVNTWILFGTAQTFCKEHGISYNTLLKMSRGYRPSERSSLYNWTVEKLNKNE